MATLTERLAVIIDAKTSGAVSEFKKVGAATDDLDRKTSRTGRALESLGISSAATGAAMKTALAGGAVAAAAGLGVVAKKGVDAYVGLAEEIRDFQRASGATAETSSRFVAVLDDMGIASEVGAKAIQKLARVDSSQLEKFGVTVAENADGTQNLEETLLNAADAYAATSDPAARARLAFQLFGRQGQDLIPILEQGRAGLEEFFEGAESGRQIFSQEDLDTARKYELAMDALGDTTSGLSREIGAGLVPALTDTVEGMVELIEVSNAALEPLGGLETVVEVMATSTVGLLGKAMQGLKGDTDEASGSQERASEVAADLRTKLQEQRQATADAAQATRDLMNATIASLNSEIAYEQAVDRLADAQAEVTVKQRELTEAQRVHGAQSAEAKAAQDALADSERGVRSAHLDVAGAAARMAEDQAKASGNTDAARVATDAYRAELGRLRDSAAPGSPLRAALDGYIGRLQAASGERVVSIRAIDHATPVITGVKRLLDDLSGRSVSTVVNTTHRSKQDVSLLLPGASTPKRAGGGPVQAGRAYLVGEQRPEVFVPDVNGRVVPRVSVAAPQVSVRVFIGNQELRDIVNVELDQTADGLAAGYTG